MACTRWYTLRGLARAVGVSHVTALERARAGKLHPRELVSDQGKRPSVYPERDVRDWLTERMARSRRTDTPHA